ncbi:GntR family transcriptional regulator [Arthrobacter sulfonylureivorans]|uniref:GntR family transcriptional regulator n=1 Tax=Arthrobacter TaxID=1663 RepID=UPI0010AC7DE1|nr:GntR family transcriptional regulator [Arthrobacter sp. CAU 1506]TJY66121.1 GntR family transcriptional regulator [Arthrobacter sp. CAU 1506]
MPTPTNSLAEAWDASPVGRVAAPLREQVTAALREAILDFRLKPGRRLVERELIEQLDVSRTTVREALRELTAEGLVTIVPQRGAIVTAPSWDDARDLYEVRAALESRLVERFVERASRSQELALAAAVESFAEASTREAGVHVALTAKDVFYEVLLAGAASPALQQLTESIQARVRVLRATSMSMPGRSSKAVDELRGVLAAIQSRDGQQAAALYVEHVRQAAETALQNMHEFDDGLQPGNGQES